MGDEFSLAALARAVWRRKNLVAIIVIGCVAVAATITVVLPKIYRAQTSVFFPEARETALTAALGALGQTPTLVPGLAGLAPTSEAAGLCKAIAESYSVRAEICRDFGLQKRFAADTFQDATDDLRDATWTTITPEGLLIIRVDTTAPQLSADIANAYARIVERLYRDSTVSRARGERKFLETRVAQAERDLARAAAELERYQKRGEALLVPDEAPPILQKLADVRVEQVTAEVELEAARRQRAEAVGQLNRLAAESAGKSSGGSVYSVPWQMSSETIGDNPDIAQIRADLVGVEVKLAAARHDLTSEHPDVKRLQAEVDETRNRLASEARQRMREQTRTRDPVYAAALGQLVTLETAVLGQEAKAAGLGQLVKQIEANAAGLPERLLRYSRLELEVRARETIYTALSGQLEAAKLKELQEQPVFQVLDVAVPPQRHDRPKLAVNLVVGLLFGMFLGAAVAAALGAPGASSTG
jgi:uncharacterized protein involved in exopolysaccharide biosynthesis